MNENRIEVSASKIKKKGAKAWYTMLTWRDENGQRHQKMKSTGIPIQGDNKRKADKAVEEIRVAFENELNSKQETNGMLLSDWMYQWLEVRKHSIRRSTYEGYKMAINSSIKPYFDKIKAELETVKPQQIQEYYNQMLKSGLTGSTVKHYHSYLSGAFKLALKQGLIQQNPLDRVELPKVVKSKRQAFSVEQLTRIFEAVRDDPIEVPVYLGSYCGLRRSEILGLQWSDIDFKNRIIQIRHTRTCTVTEIFEDNTKSETSKRKLPLDEEVERILLNAKKKQEEYKLVFGNTYQVNDFVCVYPDGKPLPCDYVSSHFRLILKRLGYTEKGYNFHALRHTAATLMCNSGLVGIKTVSEYLGHSNISTTSIYLHPDMQAKLQAVNVLSTLIKGEKI